MLWILVNYSNMNTLKSMPNTLLSANCRVNAICWECVRPLLACILRGRGLEFHCVFGNITFQFSIFYNECQKSFTYFRKCFFKIHSGRWKRYIGIYINLRSTYYEQIFGFKYTQRTCNFFYRESFGKSEKVYKIEKKAFIAVCLKK